MKTKITSGIVILDTITYHAFHIIIIYNLLYGGLVWFEELASATNVFWGRALADVASSQMGDHPGFCDESTHHIGTRIPQRTVIYKMLIAIVDNA